MYEKVCLCMNQAPFSGAGPPAAQILKRNTKNMLWRGVPLRAAQGADRVLVASSKNKGKLGLLFASRVKQGHANAMSIHAKVTDRKGATASCGVNKI